jgi:hypothetical protein
VVLPNHQHALKIGTELVKETSENLYILTQLSAGDNFIEVDILFTDAQRDMTMTTDSISDIKKA